MNHYFTYTNDTTQRLDIYLSAQLSPQLSRSRIQTLIKDGCVSVNGEIKFEKKLSLQNNDIITLCLPEIVDDTPVAENIPLNIIYEDSDLIILNKAAGMVVHPANGNWQGTLVNALLYHCGSELSGIGGVKRPGIVHRLDKNTSGIMVVAKNDLAHQGLSALFADHGKNYFLERSYYALVWGKVEQQQGTITTYLGRDERDRTKQKVVNPNQSDARLAVTHYELCKTFANESGLVVASLVRCNLETGRTHQIRVHMAHIGHSLVGDPEYSKAFKAKINLLNAECADSLLNFNRQALHASTLGFCHPRTDEKLIFTSPLADDFQHLLTCFEKMSGAR